MKMRFKYETLTSLFQKTDAFNEAGLGLLRRLREAAWQKWDGEAGNTPNEETLMKRYENLLAELEVRMRTTEAREAKKKPKPST